jgi:hypothetical protein
VSGARRLAGDNRDFVPGRGLRHPEPPKAAWTAGAVVQRAVFGAVAESARMVARPFVARILVHSDCDLVADVDSVTRTVIGHLRVCPQRHMLRATTN